MGRWDVPDVHVPVWIRTGVYGRCIRGAYSGRCTRAGVLGLAWLGLAWLGLLPGGFPPFLVLSVRALYNRHFAVPKSVVTSKKVYTPLNVRQRGQKRSKTVQEIPSSDAQESLKPEE